MSTSGFDPHGASGVPQPESAAPGLRAGAAPSRDLLASVLKQTLMNWAAEESPTARDMAALREVARRHRGRPFNPETIAVEMVQAVLGEQYEPLVATAEAWQALSAGIAQTLCEDPVSHNRLRGLWDCLSEIES